MALQKVLYDRLKDTIYDLGYAELNVLTCKISTKGIEIIRKGGWLKYCEQKERKAVRTDRKEAFDYYISKWRSRTFWPLLILGLFGGIYSVIDLYGKFTATNVVRENKKISEENKKELSQKDQLIY